MHYVYRIDVRLVINLNRGETYMQHDFMRNELIVQKKLNKHDLKKFIRLIWSTDLSKSLLFIGLIGSILTTATQLMIPLVTQRFIDGVELDFFTPKMIAGIIAVFVIQVLLDAMSNFILHKVGHQVIAGLRTFLWKKVTKLPVKFFDQYASGEVVSRITNDTIIVQNLITSFFPQFVTGIITVIGVFFILVFMDWKMTLVMLVAIPLVTILVKPLGNKIALISKEMQDETAVFSGKIQQTISEARLMKSSTAEPYEKEKGKRGITRLYKIGLKEARYMSLIAPLMYTLMMGIVVMVIGYGGYRVAQGVMTTGSLVAFLLYLFQVIFPAVTFMNFFMQIQKAAGATNRIIDILDEEEEPAEVGEEVDITNLPLHFENVSFEYTEGNPILKKIQFTTNPGEKIAFAGPSGGGKTTLFALIERFYEPNSGQIIAGDIPVQDISIASWRSQIGYVSQENAMMSGTIRENLCYGLPENAEISDEELWRVAEMAYARGFIEAFPDGLDEMIGERGIKLSGGQRQRINIARAFLRNPKILMMDEATASLDSQSERIVSQALNKLMEGRTTFVIAHRLSTIIDANKILFIDNGEITGMGTHEELLNTHPMYGLFAKQQLN